MPALALLATATSAPPAIAAQALPRATPEDVGLSRAGLDRATAALRAHVEAGDIAGAVGAVVRDGRLVYLEAVGELDRERRTPMPTDALFRIYSMTRPVTSLAAMMLWEEGAFRLDEPVSTYLPDFAEQRVLVDADATDASRSRPRASEMTVEHLLLHTSGLGSRSSRLYRTEGVRSRAITLERMVANAARVPLFEDPGTRFRYGISTTVLGRLIEVWSGMPLDDFMRERIFEPLGMRDTGFWVEPDRVGRLATVYRPTDGALRPHAIEDVPFTERPALLEGGVGLVTSTLDFARFCQLFLNGGELDGVRLIRPETARMMTTNRIPDALLPLPGFFGGSGWGLGFAVVREPDRFRYPVAADTYWWDGSAGTRFFVDPAQEMITIVMAQVSPSRGGGFREAFQTAVDGAVVERR